MTTNNDLFIRPPLSFEIPNDGVTNVDRPEGSSQWEVLKYELESFVCEGEYEYGLQRILDSYTGHRNRTTQPAVWVSGFYGSGKSHLVRVLQHLWADTEFPNGATARGLTNIPQGIHEQLTELTTISRRDGAAPWAAAGALDRSGDSLNSVFLSIVLGAAGLPTRVAPAQVALWLAGNGHLEAVRDHVALNGGDLIEELSEYNLSTLLANAILAVEPQFASSARDVRAALRNQFPPNTRWFSTDETIALLKKILEYVGNGQIPPSLVVLDEVQQYISGDGGRAMEVQNLVESVSRELNGRVLLVATGQQELTADSTLQKIQDRFTVKVVLKNQDVDAVVRRVLLSKEPAKKPTLDNTLASVAGQISRQLIGSKIQHTVEDDKELVDDYPLLPVRRRFWESVLRQADAGRAGQLRSQLRIVHEANRKAAPQPVGTVVGADFLYAQKNEDLNGAGLLLKETQTLIHEQGQKAPLRGRILGLIHLIGLLPTSGHVDIGVRATADHLVDLLVEDLAHDSDQLRQQVPAILEALADEGVLQQDGAEYRLQTKAGREWDEAVRRQYAQLSDSELSAERDSLLLTEVNRALPATIQQGRAKESRKLALHADVSLPPESNSIPIWLRSEWDEGITSKQFDEVARSLGVESPMVLVHLPKVEASAFESAIRNKLAAKRVIDQQGIPQDDEGRQARSAMQTRLNRATDRVNTHVREVISKANVLLGGGTAPSGNSLRERIEAGAQSAATRLFPRFSEADDNRWPQVMARVRSGSAADALKAIQHEADPEKHIVVKEVLGHVSSVGTSASDVEKIVTAKPLGWPRDALMASIGVLLDTGVIRATLNGSDATTADVLKQTRLGNVQLRREVTMLKPAEKIQARQVLSNLGFPTDNDGLASTVEEAAKLFVDRAKGVSGPAPLPDITVPGSIQAILSASGNDRVHALLSAKTDLTSFNDRLGDLERRLESRKHSLELAHSLASSATELESASAARERLVALAASRDLLADADPIAPIVNELAEALRDAIHKAAVALSDARATAIAGLQQQPAWTALDDGQREALLTEHHLGTELEPKLADAGAVLTAVQARPLQGWTAELDAIPQRASRALEAAVQLTAPAAKMTTVRVSTASFSSADEIERYIEALRVELLGALNSGNDTVMVKG
ncbi:BREX system P-loop protein BrxC [Brevibacterium sp. JSBI002]|uniref:BREX system P-loop protein BrxC n=1 Tax=Brevibacterium sp. JSBI002 TaxID=2886045 RepID=UPI00222E8036|nr:BREX system P-loop protein BrxC [Brevibacterium sp. JSBI002]UZD61112.1 BREX system P-loop protein BrxC [Brevibacterium sp. JSBI002]